MRERLDRGVIAVAAADGRTHLSWRLLQTDPPDVTFNVYRSVASGKETRLNAQPVRTTTDLVDTVPPGPQTGWRVVAILNGREAETSAATWRQPPIQTFRPLRLREDVRSVDRVGIGDLDGDGQYDFVVKHPSGNIDPGRRVPSKDTYKIDGYNGRTGEFLWRIDLGWNINHGIWFSPMVVRDLDGDGKAEVVPARRAVRRHAEQAFAGGEGVRPGRPRVPVVYEGETGKELDKVDWIERGEVTDWADTPAIARAGT